MEFQEYEKDGRVISATETAYRAIYEAQGFKLRSPTALEGGKRGGKQEAIRVITEKVRLLERHRTLDAGLLAFYVEKLVTDILDYCHRADFPEPLVYSAVDLIRKRLADEDTAGNELGVPTNAPLSSVKMDDTEFKFAVSNIDLAGCLADLDFATLKPKLNRWRKVVSLP